MSVENTLNLELLAGKNFQKSNKKEGAKAPSLGIMLH